MARMSGATRYLLRQLSGPVIYVTLTLTGLVWLTQSLRFVDLMINKGVSAGMFLYLTSLTLPRLLVLILPVALFCAVLQTYRRLDGASELVVLRAAGLSPWALAKPAIIVAMIVTLGMYALTLYFAPAGQRELANLRFSIRDNFTLVQLQEGIFNSVVRGITVYVRERRPGGELRGILVYDDRDKARPVTMMAERGALIRSDEGPRFVLVNGNRQQVDADRGGVSLLYFDEYTLDLRSYTSKAGRRQRKLRERFLHELFQPQAGMGKGPQIWKLQTEGHRRLATPIYAIAFTLIALAAVLAGEFNRQAPWRRILIACCAAIALEAAWLSLNPYVGESPMVTTLIYATPLGAIAVALYLLGAGPRRRTAGADLPVEP